MAVRQNITLRIRNREYPLTIELEKEELYRLAERKVNELIAKYEGSGRGGFILQDWMALAALDLAIENIRTSQSREVGNDDVKELNRISEQISEYLNRL